MNACLVEPGVECKLIYYPKTVATLAHGHEDLGSDYRTTPENVFPAALMDIVDGYSAFRSYLSSASSALTVLCWKTIS